MIWVESDVLTGLCWATHSGRFHHIDNKLAICFNIIGRFFWMAGKSGKFYKNQSLRLYYDYKIISIAGVNIFIVNRNPTDAAISFTAIRH